MHQIILITILVNITEVFAFENKERNGENCLNGKKRGWDRFDWIVEFTRQGIGTADDQKWKITNFNARYEVVTILLLNRIDLKITVKNVSLRL